MILKEGDKVLMDAFVTSKSEGNNVQLKTLLENGSTQTVWVDKVYVRPWTEKPVVVPTVVWVHPVTAWEVMSNGKVEITEIIGRIEANAENTAKTLADYVVYLQENK